MRGCCSPLICSELYSRTVLSVLRHSYLDSVHGGDDGSKNAIAFFSLNNEFGKEEKLGSIATQSKNR